MKFVNAGNMPNPKMIDLEPGTTYSWCQCGRTNDVPFCDGSHTETDSEPLAFTVGEAKAYAICTCGKTKNPPYCDGSHLG
jgi:CDGSH iron-sulfur domain-containing protein 3